MTTTKPLPELPLTQALADAGHDQVDADGLALLLSADGGVGAICGECDG